MQVLFAVDLPVDHNQEGADFCYIVGDPPQTITPFGLTLPFIVRGAHGGICARTKLERTIDLVHNESVDISLCSLFRLQVVVQGTSQDECIAGAIDPTSARLCFMGCVEC